MPIQDQAVSVHPYWKVSEGKMDQFKGLCQRAVAAVGGEPKCLYYGFTFNGDEVFCREAYDSADGLLEHVAKIGPLLKDFMEIAEITHVEVHGPEEELSKLKQPLSAFSPNYFT